MSQYLVEPYVRDTSTEPTYTFAEVQYGRIVSINKHWVPLNEFYKFFEANCLFIDITGVLIDGEPPAVGDVVNTDESGYKIIHSKKNLTNDEIKNRTIEILKLTRNVKELEPIMYNNILFDADKDSLNRMDKARKLLEDNNQPYILWTTADNNRVPVSVEDFKGINTAIAMRSNDLHIRYNVLKQYILELDEKYISLVPLIDWDWDIEQDLDNRLFIEFPDLYEIVNQHPKTEEEIFDNIDSDQGE